MTIEQRLERDLPDILGDLSMGPYPDYIDDVLSTTGRRSQRPGWTFPERWLPVELVTQRVSWTRVPWRQIGVLALLALLVAGALALYVGSQQRRLPPAFGPAANGQLAFAQDGGIFTADPKTGVTKAIIDVPGLELRPSFSPDGTHVVFARGGALFVARDDGSGLVQITAEPLVGLTEWSFSPDGRTVVALAKGDKGQEIVIVPSDGRGEPTAFPVIATEGDGPPQYRADGSEIMFVGHDPAQPSRGVYALDPTTSNVRTIVAPIAAADIYGARWSPDGKHIAYGTVVGELGRTHVVGADGTADTLIDTDPDSAGDGGVEWSNDSTRVIVSRFYADGSIRSVILPIDRSNRGLVIDCPPGAPSTECAPDWTFSPDDSLLLGSFDRDDGTTQQFLADTATGKVRVAPWTASGHPNWQRVAR